MPILLLWEGLALGLLEAAAGAAEMGPTHTRAMSLAIQSPASAQVPVKLVKAVLVVRLLKPLTALLAFPVKAALRAHKAAAAAAAAAAGAAAQVLTVPQLRAEQVLLAVLAVKVLMAQSS